LPKCNKMTPFSVEGLSLVLSQFLPEPHAGLLAGLLFGTKSTLNNVLYQDLVRTGTLHIIALSGMNISLVTGFIGSILALIFSKRIASLLTILSLIWFVNFVGLTPSVIRAAIMGGLTLIAVIFGRANWALLSWLLAVSIMLLLNIHWISDLSFQLSALATLGMILFGSYKSGTEVSAPTAIKQYNNITMSSGSIISIVARETSRAVWNISGKNLQLTLSAQVFTIPLIFLQFHRVSLVSPVSNLLIGWTILPASVFGWLAALAGSLWLPLGILPAWAAWGLLRYLLFVVEWTSRLPLASWPIN